jgi:hypothetical protein
MADWKEWYVSRVGPSKPNEGSWLYVINHQEMSEITEGEEDVKRTRYRSNGDATVESHGA